MLAEGNYLEMTFFIQIPGNHHQRLQPVAAILLLHLGNISGFFYKVIFTVEQMEI